MKVHRTEFLFSVFVFEIWVKISVAMLKDEVIHRNHCFWNAWPTVAVNKSLICGGVGRSKSSGRRSQELCICLYRIH